MRCVLSTCADAAESVFEGLSLCEGHLDEAMELAAQTVKANRDNVSASCGLWARLSASVAQIEGWKCWCISAACMCGYCQNHSVVMDDELCCECHD